MMNIVDDCLGMEFELSDPQILMDFKNQKVNEKYIKGVALNGSIELINITLDPRTSYKGINKEKMPIEFILNHRLCEIGWLDFNELGHDIENFIIIHSVDMYFDPYINDIKYKLKKINPLMTGSIDKTTIRKFDERTTMVHVTCACPLKSIFTKDDADYSIAQAQFNTPSSAEARNFTALIACLKEGAGNIDPKQKMQVMNRTSFGSMFALLSCEDRESVISAIKSLSNCNTKIHPKAECTLSDLYSYLNNFEDSPDYIEKDPTSKVNPDIFLGISALGNTLVKNDEYYWPIFEFRNSGNPKIINIKQYIGKIENELEKRKCNAPNFKKCEK